MKWGLSEKAIDDIHAIFQDFPVVKKVILYGSRAKGNFRQGSDIDLTLLGDGLNFDILSQISTAFEESYLPYRFDLSIFATLDNPDFIDHIQRVGVVFYER